MSELIDGIIQNAEKLGQLSATAIWAFFTLLLVFYIYWDMRAKKTSSDQAWSARIDEAKADSAIANAMEKLADQVKELRHKLKCIGGDDD